MKKIVLFLLISLTSITSYGVNINAGYSNTIETGMQDVVFRTTQRLRANDGREIYLYPNRKCELYDNDRREVTCTYRLQNGEVLLLDEYGNTVYKGSYRMSRDGVNISSITLAGTTYYRK